MSDRPSPIAGTWYPGNAAVLSRDIAGYIERAKSERPPGDILALVVPHAGYFYSAHVAASAFRLVQGLRPQVVAVLSPLHQAHPARLLTTGHEAYVTPLGRVEVARDRVERLGKLLNLRLGIGLFPLLNDQEHSLEIELPFLQHLFREFLLVPVMMRDQSAPACRALGEALAEVLAGSPSMIVASSDLSHFHPQKRAMELDGELLRRLADFDPEGILDAEVAESACGRGAIAATLWAARQMGANRVTIVHHATSGESSGDYHSVVGYGAAVISRSGT